MAEAVSEATDSGVALAPEGSGPGVRTITVYHRDPVSGTFVPVRMQVTVAADEQGHLIGSPDEWQTEVLHELKHMNETLTAILDALD